MKRIRELFGLGGPRPPQGDEAAGDEAGGLPHIRRGPRVEHRPIPESDLDPDAVKIIRRLTRFDHTAYLVGGCVRDLLLDRRPKDFDIGTSATPRQVKRLFRNSRIIGRRFRLAHIYFHGGKIIEVATFRGLEHDGESEGGDLLIRDDNVFGTAEEDALRRDFTVNALFYDLNAETVLDHAGGLDDLRRRNIRTIGDPEVRFREDPIRILRAIKFAARLDFRIEPDTLAAIHATREEIPKAASPRILEELNRFCRSGAARASFRLMEETGVAEIVLPELSDAYRDAATRSIRDELLGAIDRRFGEGHEAATGEILAALLLPILAPDLGWSFSDGTVSKPKGLNVRERIDGLLRPMATRLRLSRRDQEHCRQIVQTLHRMVPAHRLRANTRRAVLRRECVSDALWILGVLAARCGKEFEHASGYWTSAAAETEPAEKKSKAEAREPRADGAKKSPARRRGRKSSGDGRREPSSAGTARSRRADMPPVWDERYFFAALPTVPDGQEPPRRPKGTPADEPEPAREQRDEAGASGDEASDRRKTGSGRRRRRRRRRRKPSSGGSDEATRTEAKAGDS